MFIKWSLKRRGVYMISLYKVGINQNRYKKNDGKGGEALKGWKLWHDPISQEEWEAVIVLFLV